MAIPWHCKEFSGIVSIVGGVSLGRESLQIQVRDFLNEENPSHREITAHIEHDHIYNKDYLVITVFYKK